MTGPETTRPTGLVQPIIDEIVNLRAQRARGQIEAAVMVEGVLNRADQIVRMRVSDPDISAYFKHVARDGDVWQGLIVRISKNREKVQATPDPVMDEQIKADLELAEALGMRENRDDKDSILTYLNSLRKTYGMDQPVAAKPHAKPEVAVPPAKASWWRKVFHPKQQSTAAPITQGLPETSVTPPVGDQSGEVGAVTPAGPLPPDLQGATVTATAEPSVVPPESTISAVKVEQAGSDQRLRNIQEIIAGDNTEVYKVVIDARAIIKEAPERIEDVIPLLQQLLEKNPPDSDYVHEVLGDAYRRVGRFQEAIDQYIQVTALSLPSSPVESGATSEPATSIAAEPLAAAETAVKAPESVTRVEAGVEVTQTTEPAVPGTVAGAEGVVPEEKRAEVDDVSEQLRGAFRARHETFVSTDLDSEERQTRLAQLDDQINALQVQLSDTLGLREEESAQAAQAAEVEVNSLHMISIANLLMASARGSTYENKAFEETGRLLRKLYAGSTPEVSQALEDLLTRNTSYDWTMGQEDSSLTARFNARLHEAAGLHFDAGGSALLGERYSHAQRSFENLASGRTAGGLDELIRVFRDKNRFQREHFQDLSARIRKVGDYERELASKAGMEIFYE